MIKLIFRMLKEVKFRLLLKFLVNFIWKGWRTAAIFRKRQQKGEMFPAFVVVSVTNACNLSCQGCWVSPSSPPKHIPPGMLDRIIADTKKKGSFFFGILGGEPLLYPEIFSVIEKHPDCYFQLFTNGTMITDETAARMVRLGNITPLISIEGDEKVSDIRRGGDNVYCNSMRGVEICRTHGLITGVATSVCRSNIDALATEDFVNKIIARGVHYLWYYIYRPVGPDPCPELALDEEQIIRLRQFIVDIRMKAPIGIVDAYWDHNGHALCPGALGVSHHINPAGDLEFCPPIQFALDNAADTPSLEESFENSEFLRAFREYVMKTTDGCVLLEDPQGLKKFLEDAGAEDVSGRNRAFAELAAMRPLPGHHLPGKEIPEKHPFYRFAKKNFFFGFGGYG